MSKPFSTIFDINSEMLALIYICYKYKFPLCFMLSFYELYGKHSLFAIKALTCSKDLRLADQTFIRVLNESKELYKQILQGVNQDNPQLDMTRFSEGYRDFIKFYLLKNVENIFTTQFKLQMDSTDLYEELKP